VELRIDAGLVDGIQNRRLFPAGLQWSLCANGAVGISQRSGGLYLDHFFLTKNCKTRSKPINPQLCLEAGADFDP
jgi:hypothetical protein